MVYKRKLVGWSMMIIDISVQLSSLYICFHFFELNQTFLSSNFADQQINLRYLLALITLIAIWHGIFRYSGLYRSRATTFLRPRHYKTYDVIKATSLGTLALVGVAFLTNLQQIESTYIITFWTFSTLGTIACRGIADFILREIRLQGRNLRHILIVGTNDRALEFSKRIKKQPELGYSIKGYVDNQWHGENKEIGEEEIVSNFDNFTNYLNENIIDEIIIALPIATLYPEASRIVNLCEEQGVVVHFVPGFDFLNIGSSSLSINNLGIEPVITIIPPPMSGWRLVLKRFFDFNIAAILIVCLSPVMIITALLVKFTSPGPILFIQERIGLNKRKFRLLKLRTMVINAEEIQQSLEAQNEAEGPVFKIDKDPRITPIGDFLRRSSLDELPQLINVLLGHMSLVGPRPLPIRDFLRFDKNWHRRRFSVRPGITCLWQVSGRSSLTFERWMELDMEYINNWSIGLDFKILFATISAVLKQRGAY